MRLCGPSGPLSPEPTSPLPCPLCLSACVLASGGSEKGTCYFLTKQGAVFPAPAALCPGELGSHTETHKSAPRDVTKPADVAVSMTRVHHCTLPTGLRRRNPGL